MDLTPENVFSLLQSTDGFPVDFEDAWRWIGYSRKDAAKNALLNAGFVEGIDFQVFHNVMENPLGGRPSEIICLTVDCFKSFAMMAGTAKGKQVRQYFLWCEAELKKKIQKEQDLYKQRVLRAVVSNDASKWEKRYEDEFFDEAYRITGWQRPKSGHPPCMGSFINKNVYDRFPEGTTEKLQRVNPIQKNGRRSRKHHQHLTAGIGIPLLGYQKGITIAVMRLSPSNNPDRFKSNMQKACGNHVQIELSFMEEFNQLDKAS